MDSVHAVLTTTGLSGRRAALGHGAGSAYVACERDDDDDDDDDDSSPVVLPPIPSYGPARPSTRMPAAAASVASRAHVRAGPRAPSNAVQASSAPASRPAIAFGSRLPLVSSGPAAASGSSGICFDFLRTDYLSRHGGALAPASLRAHVGQPCRPADVLMHFPGPAPNLASCAELGASEPEPLVAAASEAVRVALSARRRLVYERQRADVFARRAAGVAEPVRSACHLAFESRFECGNLDTAVQVDEHAYELAMSPDYGSRAHTQWFFFAVTNMQPRVTYSFAIVNFAKPGSTFSAGQQPLLYSEALARQKGLGWVRMASEVRYGARDKVRGGKRHVRRPKYVLSFKVTFPAAGDTVYVAFARPFSYSMMRLAVAQAEALHSAAGPSVGMPDAPRNGSPRLRVRELCRSLCGNSVPLLAICNFGTADECCCGSGVACVLHAHRLGVVMTARVHPGEVVSSWMVHGAITFLLGETHAAHVLREHFVFLVVPMLNPDGVVVGNYRCDVSGVDLNRAWQAPDARTAPTIVAAAQLVASFACERSLVLFIDFHGHSRKQNAFMYGATLGDSAAAKLAAAVAAAAGAGAAAAGAASASQPAQLARQIAFPYLVAQLCDFFNFADCSFVVSESRQGTARLAVASMGVAAAFTLEASFCGISCGERAGTYLNACDYEAIGQAVCLAVLEYCDPSGDRVAEALAAIAALRASTLPGGAVGTADEDSDAAGSDVADGLPPPPAAAAMGQKSRKRRRKRRHASEAIGRASPVVRGPRGAAARGVSAGGVK